jgi:hypothetical protein
MSEIASQDEVSPQSQVLVSLDSDGFLQMGLPGYAGATRWVPLRSTEKCDPTSTLRRTLEALALGQAKLGEDGSPTRAQVIHWERHRASRDQRCPFCMAELRGIRRQVERSNIAYIAEGVTSSGEAAKRARATTRQANAELLRRVEVGKIRGKIDF